MLRNAKNMGFMALLGNSICLLQFIAANAFIRLRKHSQFNKLRLRSSQEAFNT